MSGMKIGNVYVWLRSKPAVKNKRTMHTCIITMTIHSIHMTTGITTMTTYIITLFSGNAMLFNGPVFLVYADATKAIDYAMGSFSICSVPFGGRSLHFSNSGMFIGNRAAGCCTAPAAVYVTAVSCSTAAW